jgi:predicted aspartyl protease
LFPIISRIDSYTGIFELRLGKKKAVFFRNELQSPGAEGAKVLRAFFKKRCFLYLAFTSLSAHSTIMKMKRRALMLGGLAICGRASAASIPVVVANQRCILPVTMDGQALNMALDTGASISVLTSAAVARCGFRLDQWVDTTLRGAGGRLETHANADIGQASAGGMQLFQRAADGSMSLAVTASDLGGVDGLLGGDILRHTMVDIDFPNATLTLQPAGWALPEGDVVPLQMLQPNQLLAQVFLDGQAVTALLDTGATNSLINARGMHLLGLNTGNMAADGTASTATVDGALSVAVQQFGNLRIDEVDLANPAIMVAAVPEMAFDMIVGLDFLGQRRLALSYSGLQMVFA